MRSLALACIVVLTAVSPVRAAVADVVVQAGHQGRPASCAPNHVKACNIGASSAAGREIDWTPVVADAMAAALRRDGLSVLRRPADYPEHDTAKVAIYVHFDGADPPCASGASIGFPPTTPAAFVHAWKVAYGAYYPFHFAGENISTNEEHYYGFHKVDAPVKMLIEYGEITCPAQAAWLQPRLRDLGTFTAQFVRSRMP
jgi:hypothetical protein